MKKLLTSDESEGSLVATVDPNSSESEVDSQNQTHSQNQNQLSSQKNIQKTKVTFRFPASRVRDVKKATVAIRQALKQRFPRLRFNNEDFHDLGVKLLLDLPPDQRLRHAEDYLKNSLPGI